MIPYYKTSDTVKFNPDDFPKVVNEVQLLKNGMVQIPIYFKEDIIVSYLKDHCVKSDWIDANPRLAELMISDCFETFHIESLFESYRKNKPFLQGFEDYLKKEVRKYVLA